MMIWITAWIQINMKDLDISPLLIIEAFFFFKKKSYISWQRCVRSENMRKMTKTLTWQQASAAQ